MEEDFIPSLSCLEEDIEEPHDLLSQLENFRHQWKQEIQKKYNDNNNSNINRTPSVEEEAKFLFYKGIKLEEAGQVYEAIKYYREATHLDQDIEFKCCFPGISPRERQESESSVGSVEQEDLDDDLVTHFQKLNVNESKICSQEYQRNATHISVLPVELLIYIMKWVVSSDLDMKQLEIMSEVSRGFYLCARDEGIWRQVCQRTWGANTGKVRKYCTWRNMFLSRPHVLFNGCYISRTTYMRCGEPSLDGFYKPFHLVEYYRYMRFFPDGVMLMMSSPDDPLATLSKLRSRNSKDQGLMKGVYRCSGDRITAVLKQVKMTDSTSYFKRKRRQVDKNDMKHAFHIELEIQNHKDRSHKKIVWIQYTITTIYKATGQESVSDIELNNKDYPPLLFSRVKSYTTTSEAPLQ